MNDLNAKDPGNRQQDAAVIFPGSAPVPGTGPLIGLKELFHIIFQKLHPLYAIDCAALVLYDEQVSEIREAYIAHFAGGAVGFRTEHIADPVRLEAIPAEIAGFDYPVLKTRQEWEADHQNNHTLLNNDDDYLFHCYIPLENNNRLLGTLELHNRQKALTTEGLSFCCNLADLLADIVSHLLKDPGAEVSANSSLIPRAFDNSDFMVDDLRTLLSLSDRLSTVRNWSDLAQTFRQQPAQFSFLCDMIIAYIVPGQQTYRISRLNADGHSGSNVPGATDYPVTDRLFQAVVRTQEPVIFDTGKLPEGQELPDYLQEGKNGCAEAIIGIALNSRQRPAGVLYLTLQEKRTLRPHQLAMVKGVACHIAVALAGISSYEAALQKERETAGLLALSRSLSVVKDKHDLETVIEKEFKQLFAFDHFSMRLINRDHLSHDIYISSLKDLSGMKKGDLMKTGVFRTEDIIFTPMAKAEAPLVIAIEELDKNGSPDYLRFWQLNGIRQLLALPLRRADEFQGVLLFYLLRPGTFDAQELALLQSMTLQVSQALNNLLANAEIRHQLDEIKSYKDQLEGENSYLQEEIQSQISYSDIIGQGPEMQEVFRLLKQVSGTDSTVLILGETGTGKELIARSVHNDSERRDKTMIKVNCAAIPANLIESELFGHEKGAFTGATERRLGKFELADNSTIFLDEIGELPLELQVKLLRVLQEKELERVGGTVTIKTDVRIIAATNRDLREEVEANRFRRDLFYRLNVFPLRLPALRNRKSDLPLLANFFLERYARKTGRKITGFSHRALNEIRNYHWPGNVRELEHLIERQVLLTRGDVIKTIDIPVPARPVVVSQNEIKTIKTIDENERDHIFEVLKLCNGKVSGAGGAAKLLGVPATTLNSKIKRLGLSKTHLY